MKIFCCKARYFTRLIGLVWLLTHIGELHGQGLIFDDDFYSSMPRQSTFGDGSRTEFKVLDTIKKVNLKAFAPHVQHQGWVSTCVGWAAGYGAYTIQKAIRNNWGGQTDLISDQAYSALFIFNQIKITDCGFGARIGDALRLLKKQGNVLSKDFDTELEDCFRPVSAADSLFAAEHRIDDFMTLFSPNDEARIKISKTKLSLVQKKPVIIGMNLLQNFANIPYRDSIWYPAIGNRAPYGGHAMVVVGFDDGLGAFEILNSWGDTWANEGYIWVKYQDFAAYCKYGFQISLNGEASPDLIYSGNFNFRRKVGRLADGTILFKQEDPQFNGEYYEFPNRSWKPGTLFQTIVSQVNNGMYLYAFSIDPDNEIKIHWPRDEALDARFGGLHESALITVPEVELFIPGKDLALDFRKAGKDYLCLLYARQPIEDIDTRLTAIRKRRDHPIERIYQVFGRALVPLESIHYTPNRMSFSNSMARGNIIPLVLEVSVNNSKIFQED